MRIRELALLCLLTVSCKSAATEENQEEIIRVAREYAQRNLQAVPEDYNVRVHDDGDAWIVSFSLKPHLTGGAVLIQVYKHDMEVVGACRASQ
jgi:hypothetical protein